MKIFDTKHCERRNPNSAFFERIRLFCKHTNGPVTVTIVCIRCYFLDSDSHHVTHTSKHKRALYISNHNL